MKKINKVKALVAAVITTMAVAATIGLAQTTGDSSGDKTERRQGWPYSGAYRGHHMMADRAFSQLDLTDEQKARLKQIRESHRQTILPLVKELRAARQEIRQSMSGGAFDEGFVTRKLTETASTQAKLMAERFKMRQEVLSVLTPDQKTKLDQLREQFKAKRAERRARKPQGSS